MARDGHAYPESLLEIVRLFSSLPPAQKREELIAWAAAVDGARPEPGRSYRVSDVRRDPECSDVVGVFMDVDDDGGVVLAIDPGADVQTLTCAMAAILYRGLQGIPPGDLIALSDDFVVELVGESLVRVRSRTVYYVLNRIRQAARKLMEAGGCGASLSNA